MERRIFKIPVGKISGEKAVKALRETLDRYNMMWLPESDRNIKRKERIKSILDE